MRHGYGIIFDEFLPTGVISSNPVFTSAEHNRPLARFNQLGVHCILDNLTVGTAGNLYGFCETSGDARNWIQRSNQANTFASGDADITIVLGTSTKSGQILFVDACLGKNTTGPLLTHVRFRFFFDQNNISGHLRVHATLRDG